MLSGKKSIIVIFVLVLAVGLTLGYSFMAHSLYTFAADLIITGNDLGITVNTSEALFKVQNMAPGFRDSASIEVSNTGQHDFSYTIGTVLNAGDQLMFDGLVTQIKDSLGNIRYSGPLSGLVTELELGTVASGATDAYTISVYFPVEAGNEYQGKTANVSFIFNARSHDDIVPGTGCIFEPPFVNRNFALKMKSTVPIKFHLVKPDGSFDYQQHDLALVISGPDANGVPQEYVFSQANGNLRFDSSLEKPHYIALLSSFDHSLKVGGYYTAAVKLGDTVLGTRDFMVDEAPGTSRSNRP